MLCGQPIGNARRKSAKEPQTVSLYEPIPGTEDLLYIDTIAVPGNFVRR